MPSNTVPLPTTAATAPAVHHTVLRVKRPRNVDPVDSLRFHSRKRARPASQPNQTSVAALTAALSDTTTQETPVLSWKRIETYKNNDNKKKAKTIKRSWASTNNSSPAGAEGVVVDAVLEPQDSHDRNKDSAIAPTKRPKLSLRLVESTATNECSNTSSLSSPKTLLPSRVLDPVSRIINDSLQQALANKDNKTVSQHLDLLRDDARLAGWSWASKLSWRSTADGSTVLHAAALWNDLEAARRVLADPAVRESLLESEDDNHQRPYQVAVYTHHLAVAELLESHGADTQEYEYDVFLLDHPNHHDHDDHDEKKKKNTSTNGKSVVGETGKNQSATATTRDTVTEENKENGQQQPRSLLSTTAATTTAATVELHGGVGYWNEDGQLILEATPVLDFDNDDDDDNNKGSQYMNNDDDEDSNAEDHVFNDYPDEYYDDDDDDDDGVARGYADNAEDELRESIRALGGDDDYMFDPQYGLLGGGGMGDDDDDDDDEYGDDEGGVFDFDKRQLYAFDPNDLEDD